MTFKVLYIKINFKIKNNITAGIENTAQPVTVYSFTGIYTPVNFEVKSIRASETTPKNMLNNNILNGFFDFMAKPKIVSEKIDKKIINK